MNKPSVDFLGIFNQPAPDAGAPPGQPPAVQTAPAGTTPQQPSVPVSALPAIIDAAADAERKAREELTRAQQVQAQVRAAQAPPPPPAAPQQEVPAKDATEELLREMKSMKRELADERRRAAAAELETYRQHAIGAGRAQGLDPAFDVYVGGKTPQDIDASLGVAFAEQNLAHQRFLSQLVQKHGAAPQVQQEQAPPPPPAGTQQVPTGYAGQPAPGQAPAGDVNAPSVIQAANPPQAQGLSKEQIQYLTSPAAIRNGDYAKYRSQVMSSLNGGGSQTLPQNWSFSNQQQPQSVPTAPGPQQAAVQQANFAGVQVPQVRPMGPLMGPPGSYNGAPGQQNPTGRAVQPAEVDAGAQIDMAAAAKAATAAIERQRSSGAYRSSPSYHGAN